MKYITEEEAKTLAENVKHLTGAEIIEALEELTPWGAVVEAIEAMTTDRQAEIGDACLNNDEIHELADEKRFLIIVWKYANEWANRPEYHIFDSYADAIDWYKTNMKDRAEAWGRASLEEWHGQDGDDHIEDDDPMEEWEGLTDCVMWA